MIRIRTYIFQITQLFIFSFFILNLPSCQENTQKKEIMEMVKSWQEKEIIFPEELIFTKYGKDTVKYNIPVSDYKMTLLITHGDINGISYEIILKALSNPQLLELCTPIIYGSPKVLGAYKKMFDLGNVNVSTISSPEEAQIGRAHV